MMLLDEPSLGLSPKLVKEIFEIILRINREQGVTVLLVEQNAHMALNIAEYGYVLEVGRIVMEDTCARLLEKEDIKEFYLGVKEGERARDAAVEAEEDVAVGGAILRLAVPRRPAGPGREGRASRDTLTRHRRGHSGTGHERLVGGFDGRAEDTVPGRPPLPPRPRRPPRGRRSRTVTPCRHVDEGCGHESGRAGSRDPCGRSGAGVDCVRDGHLASAVSPRGGGARRQGGDAGEGAGDLAGHQLAASTASGRSGWGWGWWRWAWSRATSCRSWPTTARSGCTPIWACCARAAVTNGIYTTDSAAQVEYIVNDSGTRFFFAENEEQLDKILQVRARCPQLVKIFVYDMEGLHAFSDPQVMPFSELLELGARYDEEHPGAFDRLVEIARPERRGDPRLHLGHHRDRPRGPC